MSSVGVKLKILAIGTYLLFLLMIGFALKPKGEGKQIVIGGKNCTEQHILAEILAQLIEAKTDIKVVRRYNMEGTTLCFNALMTGTIDTYFEYTGTALLHILKEPLREGPLYPYVKEAFEKRYNLTWLEPLGFSNTYVLIAKKEAPFDSIGEITTRHEVAYDPEFSIREEALLLSNKYPFTHSKLMDQVILYMSLLNDSVDVISGFSTSGRLEDPRFKTLKDEEGLLPAYEVAPIVRGEILERYPELVPVFALLKGALSEKEMRSYNHQVEFEGKSLQSLAKEYIKNFIL